MRYEFTCSSLHFCHSYWHSPGILIERERGGGREGGERGGEREAGGREGGKGEGLGLLVYGEF